MKIEHIAVASTTKEEADRFFSGLLGLKKVRSFSVSADLMEKFFGQNKQQKVITYQNSTTSIEVFITEDNSYKKDLYTHTCLLVEDRDKLVEKALSMNFPIIKVPRKNGNGYYLFVKDSFQNLYEVKEL
jgi:catechol 2,3-dioxygenase-like lactoylglutathione lyase family enzyme